MRNEVKAARALWPFMRRFPGSITAIVLLGVLSSLSEGLGIGLLVPLLQSVDQQSFPSGNSALQRLLEAVTSRVPAQNRLLVLIGLILASVVLTNALSYTIGFLSARLDSAIGHRLRSRVFDQLLTVSYSFWECNDFGKLLDTLATETWRTSQGVAVAIGLITNCCTMLVFASLLLLISWKLSLMIGVGLVLISALVQLITRPVKALGAEAVEVNAKLGLRMWDAASGIRVIHAFWLKAHKQAQFDRVSDLVRRTFLKIDLLSGLSHPVSEVLHAALLAGILLVALRSQAGLPGVLVFLLLLRRMQPHVNQFDSGRVQLLSLLGALQNVTSMLRRTDKPYIVSGKVPFTRLQSEIRFESVGFRYQPDHQPALRDVSLHIPQGKVTAIVGPSGAGKTTLINLLSRLYDPTEGEIRVDGTPLRQFDLAIWRGRIALAGQDMHLFSTTVRENIGYGRLDASDAEIIEAAKAAYAHEFIMQLPQGYETRLGEQGARLSGGERQRIALARAFLRDPEILILDEATNALDSISERLIQQAIENLSRNRTVIVVAHRLSTVQNADRVIVLQEGRVIEQGQPHELLGLNGLFAELCNLQRIPAGGER